jgi:hypothetical protein
MREVIDRGAYHEQVIRALLRHAYVEAKQAERKALANGETPIPIRTFVLAYVEARVGFRKVRTPKPKGKP